MFITQYAHRLLADYDMGLIRKRAAERGLYWGRYPALFSKTCFVRRVDELVPQQAATDARERKPVKLR